MMVALVACPTEEDDKGAGGEGPTAITSFVAMPTDIAEDGGESTVTLTVNRAIPMDGSDLTFPYTIGGTGITVDDITADSLTGSITVEAGSATGTLTITAVDDVENEDDGETMTITLGALPMNADGRLEYNTGIDGMESIFITDNDRPPVGTPTEVRGFRAVPTEITEDANGTPSATVTLTLDATLLSGATPLSFPYAIAGAGITLDDLTAPSSLTGSITVEAGSATGTLTITAADDDRDEDAESLTITLGALPMNANTIMLTYSTGIDGEESITITDNDDPNLPPQVTVSTMGVVNPGGMRNLRDGATSLLRATDGNDSADALGYTLSTVNNGSVEWRMNDPASADPATDVWLPLVLADAMPTAGSTVDRFTQADIDAGRVRFVHDASVGGTGVGFAFTVSDDDPDTPGTATGALILRVNALPMALAINRDVILPEATAGATGITFSAMDAEDAVATLIFTLPVDASNDNASFTIVGTALHLAGAARAAGMTYAIRVQVQDRDGGTATEGFTLTVNSISIAGSGYDTLFGTADDGPVLSGQEVIGEERASNAPLAIGSLVDVGASGSVVFEVGNSADGTFAATATHSTGAVFSTQTIDGEPALIFTPPVGVGGFLGAGDYEEDLGTAGHPTYSVWIKSTSGGQSRVRGYEFNLYDRVDTVPINSDSEVITTRDFHIGIGHTWLRLFNTSGTLVNTLHWANAPREEIITNDGDTLDINLEGRDADSMRFLTHGLIYRSKNIANEELWIFRTADDQTELISGSNVTYLMRIGQLGRRQ